MKKEFTEKYISSANELGTSAQKLNPWFDLVFEISLNTSLAVEKLDVSHDSSKAYDVLATSIEIVAKKLKNEMQELINLTFNVIESSLKSKCDDEKIRILVQAISLIVQADNKAYIETLKNELFQKLKDIQQDCLRSLSDIDKIIFKMNKLNEQLWLILSQLRVQLSQHDQEVNLESIAKKIDQYREQIELQLSIVSFKSNEIKKLLNTQ